MADFASASTFGGRFRQMEDLGVKPGQEKKKVAKPEPEKKVAAPKDDTPTIKPGEAFKDYKARVKAYEAGK
jgi:hypothetical protein